MSDTITKERLQKLSGILKECNCESQLQEDAIETAAAITGLLSSGLITVLLAAQKEPIAKIVNGMSNSFIEYINSIKNNINNTDIDNQIKIRNAVKELANKINTDSTISTIVKEINKTADDYNHGYKSVKPQLNILISELRKELKMKFRNPVDRQLIEELIKFMTNDLQ